MSHRLFSEQAVRDLLSANGRPESEVDELIASMEPAVTDRDRAMIADCLRAAPTKDVSEMGLPYDENDLNALADRFDGGLAAVEHEAPEKLAPGTLVRHARIGDRRGTVLDAPPFESEGERHQWVLWSTETEPRPEPLSALEALPGPEVDRVP